MSGAFHPQPRFPANEGQLKTRHGSRHQLRGLPHPVLAEPKKIIRALDQLRSLKTFPSPDAVNTTTGPQLPKYVSHALGSLYQPWKPGYLRSAYGANLDGAPTELPRL